MSESVGTNNKLPVELDAVRGRRARLKEEVRMVICPLSMTG